MLRGITAFPALALLSVLLTSTRADAADKKSAPSTTADQDPIAFFASLAELPTEQQDAFLMLAGQSMMQNDPSITCNIFGGKDSCKTMSAASNFAKECKKFRPDLKWCVQALPECGSFKTHVHKAIFPAILEAKKAEDRGQPQSIAIAEAVPGLVAAMSKTMACKEMCQAAVSTCSCKAGGDDTLTFGEAIENAEKVEDGFKQLGLQTLGDDFKDTLFRDIWDKPLCDIFTSKDDAEFAGDCDRDVIGENAKCTSAAFCEGLDDAQRAGTETIIATQLARSVFAFVEGPAGVISQRSSSTDVAKSKVVDQGFDMIKKPGTGVTTPPEKTAATTAANPTPLVTPDKSRPPVAIVEEIEVNDDPPPEKKGGSTFGTIFGLLLLLTVVGAVAAFGWKKYQEYKASRYGGDYGPMGMEAYGDDGIPLQ